MPGLGHVLFSNGDGFESGAETDVPESCQPLPITNATSPPDRMETEGRDWSGEGGVEVTDRTCDPIVATPAVSPPLPPNHRHLCGPHPANWPMPKHTHIDTQQNNIRACSRRGRTFAVALSRTCVMIDKCCETKI